MTKLKVCGFQPGDDLSTLSATVTHAGVIFVERSRRYVHPEQASDLVRSMPAHCKVMGVFVDKTLDEVLSVLETSGVHGAQLHGHEDAAECQQLRNAGYIVWKSVQVGSDVSPDEVAHTVLRFADAVDGILLDSAPPKAAAAGVTGGHGNRFNWHVLPAAVSLAKRERAIPPIWVAGGLTPENVGELFSVYRPDGVDVSSGVEEMGRKSASKIRAMIEAVDRHSE